MRRTYSALLLALLFIALCPTEAHTQLDQHASHPAVASATGAAVSAHELSMPAEARKLYASGMRKLSIDKNPSAALEDFHKAIGRAPSFYEAHYQSGFACLALGDVSEAEKHFQKSLELSHGKYGEAEIALGSLLIDQHEIDSGEKHIRRGLQTAPNFWMAYYYLGKLALERNDLQEAETCAEQARVFGPSNAMAYQLLQVIHLKQKNYPAVLQDIDSYLALDATSAAAVHAKQLRQQVEAEIQAHVASK